MGGYVSKVTKSMRRPGFDGLCDLSQRRLSDKQMRTVIRTAFRTGNVVQFDLTAARLPEASFTLLCSFMAQSNSVRELDISDLHFGNDGTDRLAEALATNKTITSLDVSQNDIGPEGCYALGRMLQRNNKVERLYLKGNQFGSAGMLNLQQGLVRNKTLKILDLEDCALKDLGATALAAILSTNRVLQKLYLRFNEISTPGFSSLCPALQSNQSLMLVDFDSNDLNATGAVSIAQWVFVAPRLSVLVLSTNLIGAAGMKVLAKAFAKTNTLSVLRVSMCDLCDEGMTLLCDALEQNTSLKSVGAENNRLTSASFQRVMTMLSVNKTLQTLELRKGNGYNDMQLLSVERALEANLKEVTSGKRSSRNLLKTGSSPKLQAADSAPKLQAVASSESLVGGLGLDDSPAARKAAAMTAAAAAAALDTLDASIPDADAVAESTRAAASPAASPPASADTPAAAGSAASSPREEPRQHRHRHHHHHRHRHRTTEGTDSHESSRASSPRESAASTPKKPASRPRSPTAVELPELAAPSVPALPNDIDLTGVATFDTSPVEGRQRKSRQSASPPQLDARVEVPAHIAALMNTGDARRSRHAPSSAGTSDSRPTSIRVPAHIAALMGDGPSAPARESRREPEPRSAPASASSGPASVPLRGRTGTIMPHDVSLGIIGEHPRLGSIANARADDLDADMYRRGSAMMPGTDLDELDLDFGDARKASMMPFDMLAVGVDGDLRRPSFGALVGASHDDSSVEAEPVLMPPAAQSADAAPPAVTLSVPSAAAASRAKFGASRSLTAARDISSAAALDVESGRERSTSTLRS